MFIVIIIFCLLLVYYILSYKENLSNISNDDNIKIDSILIYLQTTDNSFSQYISFLLSIKNTNLHLIDSDVFSTFKVFKKLNLLTKQSIIDEMKLQ